MKNVHLIPTDKPSRLLYFGTSKELTLQVNPATFRVFERSTQNIYITSDEEIKEGYVFNSKENIVEKISREDIEFVRQINSFNGAIIKNIILTTDQDLINDGVQKIDDEFLEWFVKNPSCEYVEIKKGKMKLNDDGEEYGFPDMSLYKIIIPKEEPKFKNRQIGAAGFVANKIMENAISKFKQETLEEAAERLYPIHIKSIIDKYDDGVSNQIGEEDINEENRESFIEGAKWQAERMYSEEEVRKLLQSQRGNCYVAILTKTRDTELASLATLAPEPAGKDGWVKQFKKK